MSPWSCDSDRRGQTPGQCGGSSWTAVPGKEAAESLDVVLEALPDPWSSWMALSQSWSCQHCPQCHCWGQPGQGPVPGGIQSGTREAQGPVPGGILLQVSSDQESERHRALFQVGFSSRWARIRSQRGTGTCSRRDPPPGELGSGVREAQGPVPGGILPQVGSDQESERHRALFQVGSPLR
ncbi:uncharacterized protein LOC127060819 isoform X22 [Serinus canaria]|uniref:uncharacterized protein LOC127060819 isoform X20 n=1 Tax=Serinus canaria TaxID=9135 RepID=UPI0021CCD254|nr:uncharacterized protein LOC127060819 isoform X20 [Serinus canaria]XP_050841362.1 uncharacterized protein LOC127060819 isoform X22 [Serinus canaria]